MCINIHAFACGDTMPKNLIEISYLISQGDNLLYTMTKG